MVFEESLLCRQTGGAFWDSACSCHHTSSSSTILMVLIPMSKRSKRVSRLAAPGGLPLPLAVGEGSLHQRVGE